MKALLLGVFLVGMAGCGSDTSLLLNRTVAIHRPDGGMGSGYIWTDGGRVLCLTAAHVTAGLKEVEVETFHHGQKYKATVLREDAALDLCLMEVHAPLSYVGLLSGWDAKVGEPVTLIGSPFGELFCVVRSNVVKVDSAHTTLQGPVLPGMSGGPVFTAHGNLAGIMVQNKVGGQLGYMVPWATVRTFVRHTG